ncbi:hypothetical protein G9A89_000497 [Geosiphon pyriformis]|nr:hypothetical protein G9A89_000497 [Geosiphon pyriformis]
MQLLDCDSIRSFELRRQLVVDTGLLTYLEVHTQGIVPSPLTVNKESSINRPSRVRHYSLGVRERESYGAPFSSSSDRLVAHRQVTSSKYPTNMSLPTDKSKGPTTTWESSILPVVSPLLSTGSLLDTPYAFCTIRDPTPAMAYSFGTPLPTWYPRPCPGVSKMDLELGIILRQYEFDLDPPPPPTTLTLEATKYNALRLDSLPIATLPKTGS